MVCTRDIFAAEGTGPGELEGVSPMQLALGISEAFSRVSSVYHCGGKVMLVGTQVVMAWLEEMSKELPWELKAAPA